MTITILFETIQRSRQADSIRLNSCTCCLRLLLNRLTLTLPNLKKMSVQVLKAYLHFKHF